MQFRGSLICLKWLLQLKWLFLKNFWTFVIILHNLSILRVLCHTCIESDPTFKILGDFNDETGAKSKIHWSNSLMNEWQHSCFAISSSDFPKIKLILLGWIISPLYFYSDSIKNFRSTKMKLLFKRLSHTIKHKYKWLSCEEMKYSSSLALSQVMISVNIFSQTHICCCHYCCLEKFFECWHVYF